MKETIVHLLWFGFVALLASLILTPLVRELNRYLGMVDKPDARRINKEPIPRGGGVAVFLSVLISYFLVLLTFPDRAAGGASFLTLAFAIVVLGYADDKWSLRPGVKLLGQIVIAFGTWAWADVGFSEIFPSLPAWLDCAITVFWIVGAINAFNLIDGLDGLATGLALIATIGMAGSLIFSGNTSMIYFHVVFFGALLGFLRYNYNPASIFLGDSGSMFIGFALATMPLYYNTTRTFFVSVGVPMLAMGVPIFDTALAIIRRTIRHFLTRRGNLAAGNDRVMTADTDHLHHRILRASGLSQRKAAWVLYGIAFVLVLFALCNLALSYHKAGLWLAGLTFATVVVVRNFARIEFYDATRLLGDMAHDPRFRTRRKYQRLQVPILMLADLLVILGSFLLVSWIAHKPITRFDFMVVIPIRVFATFIALVIFRAYATIWARAVISNYMRLFLASFFGTVLTTLCVYYTPGASLYMLRLSFPLFVVLPFFGFAAVRLLRPVMRDLFYTLDCNRLIGRKDISRVLVYGSGLRYAYLRREFVRSAAKNRRIIVGILDDDILLRGHYIGGIQVKGTINDAPSVINKLNVDAVVIACETDEEWMKVVMDVLRPTGVKISCFKIEEEELK